VAFYARVSSEQQVQQATISSQVEALRQRIGGDGHTLLAHHEFIDDGYTGSTLVRPALERLRDAVAGGAIDILYVHSPDRLARKYAYQVVLLEEFQAQHVEVLFVQGDVGQTPEAALLLQMQGMIAEYERAKILERSRRGKTHRARQGSVSPLSAAPYGFRYQRRSPEGDASYQIVLHEARIVRQVFEAFVREQKSIARIVRDLNGQGVPTPFQAQRWRSATVWRFLRNPAYRGQAAFARTEAVDRSARLRPIRARPSVPRRIKGRRRTPHECWISIPVPRIVADDLFDAAQEQLERNAHLARTRGKSRRYLLQGLTVCARCGYAYVGRTVSRRGKHKPLRYYHCLGTLPLRYGGQRVCHNRAVNTEQLEQHVWRSLCATLNDPARVIEHWTRRMAVNPATASSDTLHAQARVCAASDERTMRRLVDAYEAGALELDDFKVRSDKLRARIVRQRELAETAERESAQRIQLRELITTVEAFADRVRSGLGTLDWDQRQKLTRLLVNRIEIDDDRVRIVYRIPPLPSSNQPPDPHSPSSEGSTPQASGCLLRFNREHGVGEA
jgi:site-specific DNA recombinase